MYHKLSNIGTPQERFKCRKALLLQMKNCTMVKRLLYLEWLLDRLHPTFHGSEGSSDIRMNIDQ